MALLSVLLGLAVISVLLAATMSRTYSHVAVHRLIVAQHVADARFAGAIEVLVRDRSASSPEIDGLRQEVLVQDAEGLVDVNTAHEEVLRALLRGVDVPEPDATASAIVDARHRLRRWATPRELVRLKLLSDEDFAQVRAYLTVLSGRPAPVPERTSNALRELLAKGGYQLPPASGASQQAVIFEVLAKDSAHHHWAVRLGPDGRLVLLSVD